MKIQAVRDTQDREAWIIYILKGVTVTARHPIRLIERIRAGLLSQKQHIRKHHKFYSQGLINNLFHHPYTKVAFLEQDLKVSRATATRYLNALAEDNVLDKQKLGRESYYINHELVELLFNIPSLELKRN